MSDESDEPDTRTTAELREELTSARIRLEQSMKRMGGEATPVPWADVASQATATERVLLEYLGELAARIEATPRMPNVIQAEHLERVARYRAELADALEREKIRVELEATLHTLREVIRMEIDGGGGPPRPRRVE